MVKEGLIEVGDYNGKRHKYVTLTEKGEEFSKKTVDLVLAEEISSARTRSTVFLENSSPFSVSVTYL